MEYPDAKLLQRERKVKNRLEKEKERKGTKHLTQMNGKNNELPVKFLNKIIQGDSGEVLKEFPDNCIDIIITSPPYNFGLDYENEKKDAIHWDLYFEKINKIWEQCARVLKSGGRFCLNVQPLFSDYIPTHHKFSQQLSNLGLIWKAEILWDKHNYNAKYTAWGSWQSPSMPYLKYTWEFIEVFCKESHKKEGKRENIDISGEEFKKWVNAKWDVAPERNMKEHEHPAMFPEAIPERLLKLFSYKSDVVLDPFNGAGTTTLVAKKLDRNYVGIDVSGKYNEIAKRRLKEVNTKLSEFT